MLILDSNLYIFQFLDDIVVVAHRWCTQNSRWGHADSKFKVLDPRSSFNFFIFQFLDAIVVVARRWCTQNPRWGHAGQLERKAPVGCGFAAALTETRAFPCSAPKCIFGELSSCRKRCGQFEAVRFLGPEWHSRSTASSRDIVQWTLTFCDPIGLVLFWWRPL